MRSRRARSIGVLGAGVVGLNVARVFAGQGDKVTVYAAQLTPATTSDVAAAIIFPHLVPPTPQILETIRRTNDYYRSLVDAGVGIYRRILYLAAESREEIEPELLPFAASYPGFGELAPSRVPGGYRYGWRADTYFVDSRIFMPYLMDRAAQLGVTIEVRRIASRGEVLALPHEIIANCTGLGARELFGDEAVYPIKGQLVIVEPVDFQDPIIHDRYHVFPRDDGAVIGGTHEPFVRELATSEEVTRQIVDGNRRVAPSLSWDRVIGVRAGLRPFREGGPRIASEVAGSKLLLHNYGHGGSGWTIAPGCAEVVRGLV